MRFPDQGTDMSLELLVHTLAFGLAFGIVGAVLAACTRSKGPVCDLILLTVVFGLLAYSNLPFSWIPTPKRVADAEHLVDSQLEGLTFVVAIVVVAVLSTVLFWRLGLVGKMAKRLSAWGAAIAPEWGKDD